MSSGEAASASAPVTSLRLQLQLGFVGVALSAVVAVSLMLIRLGLAHNEAALHRALQEQVLRAGADISTYADDLERKLDFVARIRGAMGMHPADQGRLLDALLRHNSAYAWVALIDPRGQAVAIALQPGGHGPRPQDGMESLARRAAREGTEVYGPVHADGERRPSMLLAVPVRDAQDRIAGSLVAKLDLGFLSFVASDHQVQGQGDLVVIDQNGNVIAHTTHTVANPPAPEQLPVARLDTPSVYRGHSGQPVLGISLPLVTLPWRVAVELPLEEADAPRRDLFAAMVLAATVAGLAALALAMALARRLLAPLAALTAAATRVSAGDFDVRVAATSGTELGTLARAFNAMTERLGANILALNQEAAERVHAVEARLASELRFQRLWDSGLLGVMFAATDGRITRANDCFLSLLGFTRDDVEAGRLRWDALTPAELRERDQAALAALARDGIAPPFEKEMLRRDGSRVPVVLGAALLPGSADEVISIVLDISERKRAEAEVRALNAQLEERVRQRTAELEAANRELETFSYSVSHDLRAPLRAINGFSKALEEDARGCLDAKGVRHLEKIRAAATRMGHLIDDLLELSHITRAELRYARVDLSELGAQALEELRRAEPHRQVDVHIEPGMVVEGDPRLLGVVVGNLLGNAWKFTAKAPRPRIEFVRAQLDGHGSGFVVRDNGAGFDMAFADRLFGAFQRLHSNEEFPGTGVGLASVHRVVSRHGGRIWAAAAPGEGATFHFVL